MKRIKIIAWIALIIFVLFAFASCLMMFADCGWKPFWHEYLWFVDLG